ncbi:hypothetical protein HMPREF0083_01070 [Aneurinibacillus aneurinilyticus ATCC 12856]|uniref:Uncharacterized protein n=1 Tax=Aneurinibacillus aneurinilyticus ATCC 12856 TaxID=649747 RepID=U1WQF1_ANEAE|nr:hypothetical protein HMPREF0083_01070 [Aneurinibacillus aneurinilyticus ATCC 12856]
MRMPSRLLRRQWRAAFLRTSVFRRSGNGREIKNDLREQVVSKKSLKKYR